MISRKEKPVIPVFDRLRGYIANFDSELEESDLLKLRSHVSELYELKSGTHNKSFGEYLRELRESRGYTQKELALELGLGQAYLSKLEHGSKYPTPEVLEKLATSLGIPEERLVHLQSKDLVNKFKKKTSS
jgi:ribosome-binding protein aMBF1 (putative translation factor)